MSWLKKLIGLDRDDQSHQVDTGLATSATGVDNEEPAVFVPLNEIERLLVGACTDAEVRPSFSRALLDAELYAATPDAPAVSEVHISTGERISILNVQSPDGAPVAAIFTSEERIAEFFGIGTGFIGVRGEDLLSIVASQGAWLNPGSPYSACWKPEELSAMLGIPVSYTVQKETRIMLGAPADPPTKLISDLRAALATDDRIVEAWLALAHWPEEGRSSWYLDVRTHLGGDEVQGLLAETFKRTDYAGRTLDMVVKKPNDGEATGIRLVPAHSN